MEPILGMLLVPLPRIATLEMLETEPIIETINKRGQALMTGLAKF